MSIGSIVFAFISRMVGGYVKTMKWTVVITALLFLSLICIEMRMYISYTIVFLIGLLTGSQLLGFTCAKNNAPLEVAGSTLAVTNGLVMLVGAVFQPLLGILLDFFWDGKTSENGMRIYEIWTYQKTMLVLPLCLIFAFICTQFMKETIHTEER
jgi:hypothetical protein